MAHASDVRSQCASLSTSSKRSSQIFADHRGERGDSKFPDARASARRISFRFPQSIRIT